MRSEFEFIENIKERYALRHVGDDCAVLGKDSTTDVVITTDILVEDIDFRLAWSTPELLGHKALAVSLSDIAAMGATPRFALLTIGIPTNVWRGKFADRLYKGWFELAEQHAVELIGGDVSRVTDKIVIDSVVMGEVRKRKAVRRSGARPGDSIFVTGALGGAAGGLELLEDGARRSKARGKQRALIERQLMPAPRVGVGERLSKQKRVTSMIDISDGLAADLHHLCDASGTGARIEKELIPVDRDLEGVFDDKKLQFALAGGEDFELLFTSPEKNIRSIDSTPITRIGEVTTNAGIVELVSKGKVSIVPALGYRHF